jgi:hypothetical protein
VGYVTAHPGQRPEDYLQNAGFRQAVGVGALSGGVAGAVGFWAAGVAFGGGWGGAIASGIFSGALSGGAGQITANLLTPCTNWYDNVAEATIFGGVIGGITGGVGYGIGKWLPPKAPAVKPSAVTPEETPINIAGRGSTGRTTPTNLKEQLAMEEVMSDPKGDILTNVEMKDPKWPASEGWVKVEQNVNEVKIHFVHNLITGQYDDFKFK